MKHDFIIQEAGKNKVIASTSREDFSLAKVAAIRFNGVIYEVEKALACLDTQKIYVLVKPK